MSFLALRLQQIKYWLIAGTLFLFCSCNFAQDKKDKSMPIESQMQGFSLKGKWKIKLTSADNKYPLPEIIIFGDKNLYSIEGKEGKLHPILDGGYYEYNGARKMLRINSANDAIKEFTVEEKKEAFALYENDRLIAEYKKE